MRIELGRRRREKGSDEDWIRKKKGEGIGRGWD